MENNVVLGLSGGVDSAVAACLLKEQGYAVTCLYLDNGVGSPDAARKTAGELGLPFFVRDIRAELEEHVCRPFGEAYRAGRTPNPCALCNPTVKFPALLSLADELGAKWIATGHYARVFDAKLSRGEIENDQSYLLARLTKDQLKRCIFPLGDYKKSEIRALASQFSLSAAERPASMEICFIPDDNYPLWLENRGFSAPKGDFVDKNGNILGRHQGIHRYTLGQGSGLGLSGPHKYYVSAIRPAENQVVLSDGSDLSTDTVRISDLNWLLDRPPREVCVRLRHSRGTAPAVWEALEGGDVLIRTGEPVRAPTPGQLAVLYDGDTVAGSGWIK